MKDKLFSLLGIEPGEESMVSILLSQSVFLGIFFGAFDISAHSLFLSVFDEKMMAKGYVVSGLAGIILTSAYTKLQTKMIFRRFAVINLAFITVLMLLLWLAQLLAPSHLVVFLVFIMLGPLNILAMLGFWGTTARLFTLRQGKRLFGLVDAGLIIGIIVSCYAIPLLLSVDFKPHNILLISSAAILTGSIVQAVIGKKFLLKPGRKDPAPENNVKKRSVFKQLREDSYIRIMAVFIALSVMTAFFVQYSFMAVTREQYPAEADMARFLGLFTGSMMIFTLLVKLLVFSYMIRNYGLKTCLAISPVLVAAFTVIAVLIGLIMGYTPATSGFMLFFMLLALSRLFSKSLKDSIESPSFKVIYQTVNENIRYEVQSGMDGTINEVAALSSGLILSFLGILSFVKLIHFPMVLFVITILWIVAALKLYSGYRRSIRNALESVGEVMPEDTETAETRMFKSRFSSAVAFKNEYFNIVNGKFADPALGNNRLFREIILRHAEKNNDINLLPVLKTIVAGPLSENEKQVASALIEKLEQKLVSPHHKDDRVTAAQKMLFDVRQPQTTQILRLLRDNSNESRRLAICLIGKFRLIDMIPEVCLCLNNPEIEKDALCILRNFGKEANQELARYFMTTSGNTGISKAILWLLGENCGNDNLSFLFLCLWSNSRPIRETALKCLVNCEFKGGIEDRDRLLQLISDIIGIMVWNLSAKVCLQRQDNLQLSDAIDKEENRWNAFLFNLLSITYDRGSIIRIRENLEGGTVESVNYALEMIDIVIDESLKPKLVPLLDIISDEDKLKSLYQFYPGEVPDFEKLTDDIINRDYNFLGIWLRACVIRSIRQIENEYMGESMVALLFSPERILREEAVGLLERSGNELYETASVRLPSPVKENLDKIYNGESIPEDLVYNKVTFLSEYFSQTGEEHLIGLAELLICLRNNDIKSLPSDGYILWSANQAQKGHEIKIIYEPESGDLHPLSPARSDLYYLSLSSLKEFHDKYPEYSEEIFNFVESNEKLKVE